MALSKTTQDHDEIRQWAEARGGKPAEVASTSETGTGILRIEFPGATNANDSNLKEIGWDEFFEKFDASRLSLVYQDVTAEGAESNFNKLIHPENASASKSTRKAAAKKTLPAKRPVGRPPASTKNTAAKKTTSTKTAAKNTGVKKASAKKTAVKKTAVKKTAVKKTASKKTATKSATTKKTAAKKAPAKKTAAKKSSAKKTTKAGAQRAAIAIKKKTAVKKGGRR